MYKFSLLLHVIAAVFLTGPFVLAPMIGLRAVRGRDAEGARTAARRTNLYALLSLVTALLGFWVLSNSRYDFGSAWVVISLTLFVIAIIITFAITGPALKRAARLIAEQDSKRASNAGAQGTDADGKAEQEDETAPHKPSETSAFGDPSITDRAISLGENLTGEASTTATTGPGQPRIDAQYGRIAAASGISAVLLLVITALMVLTPFGG